MRFLVRWAGQTIRQRGSARIPIGPACSQFLISELPVTVERQHLTRGERPPPLVDDIIRTTYGAIVADYRSGKPRARKTAP
jgi:hypothetical protein